jgi:phospho-N-acetylmuramoyl-pentapeptide-transferase
MIKQVVGASVVSLALTLILTPPLIKYLKHLHYGQVIRSQGPDRHQAKAGTPTMGGVVLVLASIVATLLFARTPNTLVSLALVAGYALIGLEDDWRKTARKRSLGLKAREKLFFQVVLALLVGSWVYFQPELGPEIYIPFVGLTSLGPGYMALVVLVATSAANAVNLTDGLDGLAAGTTSIALLTYTVIALEQQSSVAVFTGAVFGACLGFLWFNSYPAQIFMGDTGSLALGAALAAATVFTKTELLLIVIGGLFVVETLSVIIQVAYFRLTGGRIFRMSPLHHHFELSGWSETTVVKRFWLAATVLAVLGLFLWYRYMA